MGREQRVGRKDQMVEEVDEDGEDLCSILEGDIGTWRIALALSIVYPC